MRAMNIQIWLPIGISLLTIFILMASGFFVAGQIDQHVTDLERIELRTEAQVSDISIRVARIEGYLSREDDYPSTMR